MTALTQSAPARSERQYQFSWADAGPFLALAALLALGFLVNPDFLSATNLSNVITRSAYVAIIAVGATFVISSGGLDLSVGSMVAFIAGITIMFMNMM
ncbi:ABC transporter permease, partial [Mesorhizobium sp. M2A.F.Ca.ET.037.01.1.1]